MGAGDEHCGSMVTLGKNTYVMNDVEVRNIMEEEAALPSEERPVNGGSGTTLEVPFLATVVGESRIGVMEVGDHNDY